MLQRFKCTPGVFNFKSEEHTSQFNIEIFSNKKKFFKILAVYCNMKDEIFNSNVCYIII